VSGWKIDRSQMVKAAVRAAAEQGVSDGVEVWLEEANRTVPIEESTLGRSGTATSQGLRGTVAYDTPYAVKQHEDTRLRHDPGRRAKWLELTMHEQRTRILDAVAAPIKRALR
jgi:hypothetical protein